MGVSSSTKYPPAYLLIIETEELQNPRSLVSWSSLCENRIQGQKASIIDFPTLQLSYVKKYYYSK